MKRRISRRVKANYQKAIRNVIEGLSRPVEVYKQPVKHECPNCYYNKLDMKSTNECKWTLSESIQKQQEYEASGGIGIKYKFFVKGRCPVCKGKGYLETMRKVWVDCKITWSPGSSNNSIVYTSAGAEGSTLLELKTHPRNFNLFKNCSRLVVDGVECKLSEAPILRGLGNQAVMVVKAFTTEKPKIDSGEILKDYA